MCNFYIDVYNSCVSTYTAVTDSVCTHGWERKG